MRVLGKFTLIIAVASIGLSTGISAFAQSSSAQSSWRVAQTKNNTLDKDRMKDTTLDKDRMKDTTLDKDRMKANTLDKDRMKDTTLDKDRMKKN